MISTSNYIDCIGKNNTVSISGDRGKKANYVGPCYSDLAPKKEFWTVWENNKGNMNKIDNDRFYVSEYVKNILLPLYPEKVYCDLDNCVLLCYEKNNEFCHRHIVALWLEDMLNVKVPEIGFTSTDRLLLLDRPEYIKELYDNEKKILKRR